MLSYAAFGLSNACEPHTFLKRPAYDECATLFTTAAALGLFCSSGFKNGPLACSASGSPSVRPVARPSQNMPPVNAPPVSENTGLAPPYAADGGFLLPKRPATAPWYAAPLMLVVASGPVKPVPDEWHAAHANPLGSERFASKNSFLPSSSFWVSTCAGGFGARCFFARATPVVVPSTAAA